VQYASIRIIACVQAYVYKRELLRQLVGERLMPHADHACEQLPS